MLIPLSVFILLLLAGSANAEKPIWPLDLATRYLTSNFMEYRPGRFHAGLDLKTQTVEGFAARAVESGSIVRVRATPTAYGRAVYLLGDSGRTYVYAHLSRFNDDLRGRVNRQRAQSGTYRARLWFKPGQLRVEQGDVLGLTGQSGTGGPHLHFEVRDKDNRPTEPQAAGFAVGDSIAPEIVHLRAWPVTPEATIQGRNFEHILIQNGGETERAPLAINGPVAFSAKIVDRSDIRDHRLEPSLIEVRLDGELVYRCANEYYDFAENALQRLEWVVLPEVRERWLHRREANTLAGRDGELWYLGRDGQGLSPGRHVVELAATDWAGNRKSVSWELMAGMPDFEESSAWQPDSVRAYVGEGNGLKYNALTPFFDVKLEETSAARRTVYSPQDGDPVMENLVMYDLSLRWQPEWEAAASKQGLRPLGAPREFTAADWPIDASVPVKFPPLALGEIWENQTVGLYRWSRGSWLYSDAWPEQKEGVEVAINLAQTGIYAVMSDEAPPVRAASEGQVVVKRATAGDIEGVTMPVWEVMPVAIVDLGSGLASQSIKVALNGKTLIVEPDLPRDRLLIEFPSEMLAGVHKLRFEAGDRAGHKTNWELEILAQ
ncbi:MAG: hypothetical protein ACI9UQ_001310 [Candidatus Krumholzibacteriia bacterium]|jgi:hypothetical protein